MSEPETQARQYVYCIISCVEPRRFTTLGIGERGDIVHTEHFVSLAAVVSDSALVEYESSRRNMMAHTRVLEEVMQEFTILPVRFGTVAPSTEAVQRILRLRSLEFRSGLVEMENRVELGLKAFWYENAIFQEIVEGSAPIRHVRDKLIGRSPEETYYERIQLGEMIEEAMWKKREEDSEQILSRLRPLVHKTVANKVITDRMVLNAAFLVEKDRQSEFDEVVRTIDEDMGKRLIFKYVGPVPPYNFVNIVVRWED